MDAARKVYAVRLAARLDELMARPPAPAAGVKLRRIVEKIRGHLLVFVAHRDIPAALDASGSSPGGGVALRPCAVFRTIADGLCPERGGKLAAHMRSVIEATRRRAIAAREALRPTPAGLPLANLA